MKIKKLIFLKPTKENHFAKIDKSISSLPGVYFLFDKELELVYIGKAQNIRTRILQHTTDNNNGRLQIIDKKTPFKRVYSTCLPKGIVKYYSCLIEKDEEKRNYLETFLLYAIKTKFNRSDKIQAIENYLKDKQN